MRTQLRRLAQFHTTSPLRRITAASALALALMASGGCQSEDWFSSSESRSALTPQQRADRMPPQHDEFDALGYRLAWRGFADMTPGHKLERFDVLGDVLVVQDTASVISVLEPVSGVRRWSDQVAGRLTKFLGNVRIDNTLLVTAESELFIFDLPSSTLKAKQPLDRVVNTKPAVVGDILVYGTLSGEILGHNQRSGFRQWGSALRGSINQDPVMVGSAVGLVSYTGQIIILDGTTGASTARVSMYDGCNAQPTASVDAMYCASRDHALYAFSSDGRQLWRFLTDAPIAGTPVYHGSAVYCDLPRLGITALDASTGKKLWNAEGLHGTIVAVRNGRLLAWDGSTATLIDPADGQVVESHALRNISILRADEFVDGNLYAVSPLGVVGKYMPKK